LLHRERWDVRLGVRSTGLTGTAWGLTMPTGLEEGHRPDDQEGDGFHVRNIPLQFAIRSAQSSYTAHCIVPVKIVDLGSFERANCLSIRRDPRQGADDPRARLSARHFGATTASGERR
jgi:hypothetical protein